MSNMTVVVHSDATDIDPNLIVFFCINLFKSIRKSVIYFQIKTNNL